MNFKMPVAVLVLLIAIAVYTNARDSNSPPPPDESASMARYIVNQADWTSVGTFSTRNDTKDYPFVQLISTSDGPKGNGRGIPYLFITPLDFTGQDLEKNNHATLLMSLAQGSYCDHKGYFPMDPRCARVILSGKIKKILKGDRNYEIAKKAIFGRHQWLMNVPKNHHFYIGKLDIEAITVLSTSSGPQYVAVNDYLKAS